MTLCVYIYYLPTSVYSTELFFCIIEIFCLCMFLTGIRETKVKKKKKKNGPERGYQLLLLLLLQHTATTGITKRKTESSYVRPGGHETTGCAGRPAQAERRRWAPRHRQGSKNKV